LFAVRFVNELVAFIPNLLADEWCNFMQISSGSKTRKSHAAKGKKFTNAG
jgi:hypothetical protein